MHCAGCSFDGGDYCGIANLQHARTPTDTDNWILASGRTSYRENGYGIGPTSDRGGNAGFYLKIGDTGFTPGGSAVLDFPPVSTSSGACTMTFYTHTYTGQYPLAASLKLELWSFFQGNSTSAVIARFWSQSSFPNVNGWMKHQVALPAAPGDVFVRMIGSIPSSSVSILALDDVTFSDSCGPATVLRGASNLNAAPSTSPSSSPYPSPVVHLLQS